MQGVSLRPGSTTSKRPENTDLFRWGEGGLNGFDVKEGLVPSGPVLKVSLMLRSQLWTSARLGSSVLIR